MDSCEKQNILNEIIRPFGFYYDGCEDAFFSLPDAWQHEFAYRALYDRAASRFQMVFDCEPVYFDYDGRTWLIEFWKGQYGINSGGEVGAYHSDRLLTPKEYPHAKFYGAEKDERLPMSMKVERLGEALLSAHKLHWWLAGFRMGEFSRPKDMSMRVAITFHSDGMLHSFVRSFREMGYKDGDFCVCDRTFSFVFDVPRTKRHGFLLGARSALAQWKNRLFVRLYRRITSPFSCTVDRLLYLYYFLPFAFRRCVGIRRRLRKRRNRSPKASCSCSGRCGL